ncbi:hypothetical protein LV716_03420 [Flagellimonas sp. HMM57]|uniref:hypothetical protein n=1 Tax=unclassified Flagellimonas TaxID=2644544 RepID=UPI0013D7E521|nr:MULTISPECIES: hypothetical protein [unclassified Flagellimonas]UII76851.1 hypothetical protein LV716_03420 [Flagellimonas sp. HMM57]
MKKLSFILSFVSIFLFMVKVNAQEITTFTGFWGAEYYQDDKELSKKEFKSLLYTNNEAAIYWKKAETNETIGYVALLAQLGLAIWTGAELAKDDGNSLEPALGSLGFGILGSLFLHFSNQNAKKAILTYNKQFDNKTTFRLVPTSNRNGIGLALKF